MNIQSVLLNKKYFKNRTEAKRYITKLGYKSTINPDPNPQSKNYYRFRQVQPHKFIKSSMRTKIINQKIRLIIGRLKK
jgi:hypothetical protein